MERSDITQEERHTAARNGLPIGNNSSPASITQSKNIFNFYKF